MVAPPEPNKEAPAPAPQDEHINAEKLNDLIANIDKRLTGGLHGSFFEQGSKLEETKRHGQLDLMFGLRKELEELKKQKESKTADADRESKGKKPAPANANMVATITNVVQGQLSGLGRDLCIAIERLEERLKKAEDRNEITSGKVKALETKLKKANERNLELSTKLNQAHHLAKATRCKVEVSSSDLEWALVELSRLSSACSELDKRLKAADTGRDADHQNMHRDIETLTSRQTATAPAPTATPAFNINTNGGQFPYASNAPSGCSQHPAVPPPAQPRNWFNFPYIGLGYWA